jgi:hypothetical protein
MLLHVVADEVVRSQCAEIRSWPGHTKNKMCHGLNSSEQEMANLYTDESICYTLLASSSGSCSNSGVAAEAEASTTKGMDGKLHVRTNS